MNAKISSIYLEENNNKIYWKITLIDEQENIIGTFGNEILGDDINFRKQTFYLMKILNNWDLLKLDNIEKKLPILVDNGFSKIKCIANSNGDCLKFDWETGEITYGKNCDISKFIPQNVSGLISTSGVLIANITVPLEARSIVANMSYLGFTELYPLQKDKELEILGAQYFKNFIYNILKLCNTKELIQSKNYPEVSIKLDKNSNIIAIGDITGNEYLYITENGYEFIEERKRKK